MRVELGDWNMGVGVKEHVRCEPNLTHSFGECVLGLGNAGWFGASVFEFNMQQRISFALHLVCRTQCRSKWKSSAEGKQNAAPSGMFGGLYLAMCNHKQLLCTRIKCREL